MINSASREAVAAAGWQGPFIRPLYSSYCFARLPDMIENLLTGSGDQEVAPRLLGPLAGRYDRVVLLFLDACGWRFLAPRLDGYPFLRRAIDEGVVSQITSQFPSTTAAHVTTIHTGLPPGESGVYEWFYYEPQLDEIIAPLLYSFAGDGERGTLARSGVPPNALYPRQTFYRRLQRRGVRSFVFQSIEITPSPYSDVVQAGAKAQGYRTLAEGLINMTATMRATPGPAYFQLYFSAIDSMAHHYGPESPQFAAELDTCLTMLERLLHREMMTMDGRNLLLLVADHGHTETDPATTIYLDKTLPQLARLLRLNRAGKLLTPAGSCRDLFLHVLPEQLAEAQGLLTDHLEGRALVVPVAELIEEGFFGPNPPSPTFLGRVGNLVVLPYPGESVWWNRDGRFTQKYRGNHGGLTRAEMELGLLGWAYA